MVYIFFGMAALVFRTFHQARQLLFDPKMFLYFFVYIVISILVQYWRPSCVLGPDFWDGLLRISLFLKEMRFEQTHTLQSYMREAIQENCAYRQSQQMQCFKDGT